MLTITETAQTFVRKIPDNPMLPPTAGLRIFRGKAVGAGPALNVAAAGKPKEGDQVLEYDGARVFLGSRAVVAVRDKMLDATLADGRIQFTLSHPA